MMLRVEKRDREEERGGRTRANEVLGHLNGSFEFGHLKLGLGSS